MGEEEEGGTNRRVMQRHPPLGEREKKGKTREREREATGRLIDRSGIPKIRHRVVAFRPRRHGRKIPRATGLRNPYLSGKREIYGGCRKV